MQSLYRLFWLSLAVVTLSLQSMAGHATIRLLELDQSGKSPFRASLYFKERGVVDSSSDDQIILPLFPGSDPFAGSRVAPSPAAEESVLLHVPGLKDFDPAQWSVTIDALQPPLVESLPRVTIKPARVGPLAAVQILVTPIFGDDREFLITVSGPAVAAGVETTSSHSAKLASAFLNPASAEAELAAQNASLKTLDVAAPAPPGDFRVTYGSGNRLLAIPRGSIGLGAGTGTVAVDYHGNLLPIVAETATDVLIYAPLDRTQYSSTDAVFATAAATAPSPMITQRPAFDTLTAGGVEIARERSLQYDPDLVYVRQAPTVGGQRYFMSWLAYPPAGGLGHSASFSAPVADVITDPNVQLGLKLYGYTAIVAANPDHYLDVTFNGQALTQATWEGRVEYHPIWNFVLGNYATATSFDLDIAIDTTSPAVSQGIDSNLLEYMLVKWTGFPRATDGERGLLRLSEAASPRLVTMGGFPAGTNASDLVVLDVTDPTNPIRLSGVTIFTDNGGGVGVEFEADGFPADIWIQRISDAGTADEIAAAELLDAIPAGEQVARFYVCPPAYIPALQPLIDHRGPGTVIINPLAAHNVFNGGVQSPESIRAAIKWYYDNAPSHVTLPAILLAAHGTLDPQDNLGVVTWPTIPPFIREGVASSIGALEITDDFSYSLISGADSLPDAIVGRIPARSAAELQIAVDRLLEYEAGIDYSVVTPRRGVFVADTDPVFQSELTNLITDWQDAGLPDDRIDINSADGLAEKTALKSYLEADPGAAFLLYVGHGNSDRWGSVAVLLSNDVPTITTDGFWPVVATFTCLNGYYGLPGGILSLAEAWLTAPSNAGAVVDIAPVSTDFYTEQRLFMEDFTSQFRQDPFPSTVGELMWGAQTRFLTDYPGLETSAKGFALFGDPETRWSVARRNTGQGDWDTY